MRAHSRQDEAAGRRRPLGHGVLMVLCVVMSLVSTSAAPAFAQTDVVTFTRDVAPIVYKHCVNCHRPGAIAPFSLLTYEEARPWARAIKQETASRRMPPWKPAAGYGSFVGSRRLPDDELALIARWVDTGAAKGDPAHLPDPPAASTGWPLSEPDLVVMMPESFPAPPAGDDVYRNFVIPLTLDRARSVRAVVMRPGPGSPVHHARMLIDRTQTSRDLDAADPVVGYDGMLLDGAEFPEGHFLGWAPGKMTTPVPDDLAWRLEPGSDLVLQLHILAGAGDTPVQVEVGFYFTDPVDSPRRPVALLMGSKTLDIPPGERAHVVEDRYRLPVDVEVLAIYPHAHYLGQALRAYAELPDGTTEPLIHIPDWDFHWQDEYRYTQPVRLPAGTTIVMRYLYDNSAANRFNLHSPPQRVRFGPQATDEMAELLLQVIPAGPAAAATLTRDLVLKGLLDNIAGLEKLVGDDPDDHETRTGLAALYLHAGRPDAAVTQLEMAFRLEPEHAPAQYNLGLALVALGRRGDAIAAYERAVAIRADYADARNNLGGLLQTEGRLTEAAEQFRLSLEFAPDNVPARYNLGTLLRMQGDADGAVEQYRRALEIAPNDAEIHSDLAQVLAGQGQREAAVTEYLLALESTPNLLSAVVNLAWLRATAPEDSVRNVSQAVALAERAAGLSNRRNFIVMDTLAAAYATAGRFDDAIDAANTAVALAQADGEGAEILGSIRARVTMYLTYRPFRTPE